MRISYLKTFFLVAIVSGILLSCQKDEEIIGDDIPRITSINKIAGGVEDIFFYYNSQGECELAISDYGNLVVHTNFYYADGVLDYMTRHVAGEEAQNRQKIVYDEQGRVSCVQYQLRDSDTNSWGRPYTVDSFYYRNDALRESRIYQVDFKGDFTLDKTFDYIYEGNMVKFIIDKGTDKERVQNFYYDEMRAFSDNLGQVFVKNRHFHDPDYFMGQNKIAGNYSANPFAYTYTYNEHGLPESVAHGDGAIYTYTYEVK